MKSIINNKEGQKSLSSLPVNYWFIKDVRILNPTTPSEPNADHDTVKLVPVHISRKLYQCRNTSIFIYPNLLSKCLKY